MCDCYVGHVVHADDALLGRQFCEVFRCRCRHLLLRCLFLLGHHFSLGRLWPVDIDEIDHFNTGIIVVRAKEIVVQDNRLVASLPFR